ncbi:MAG TPA: hypothetical protein VKH35_09525 [Thermoanaerobaculia bacterium]|nr:hypothetical protein [Thermoanaerobaculia bacterium]
MSLEYSIPVAHNVTPWAKVDIQNVLNTATLIGWNTSISPDNTGAKDPLGYATSYTKSKAFGNPTGSTSYVQPRQYLLYVGVRF